MLQSSRVLWHTDLVRNVTIALDDETARWARVEAARQGTSLSRLVARLLREQMPRENSYELARQAYLAEQPRDLSSESGAYPSRDDLYR